ncbi:MAG: LemA family protein [Clostridia bacterium]
MEIYVLLGVLALIIIIGIWFAASYNGFVTIKNRVEEAFATMDVFLKKRYDLIPNLVETVKGYASHEAETLNRVVQARNMASGAATIEDKQRLEGDFANTLKSLFAVVENYPNLKADQQFLNLQDQLTGIEGEIANARKYYNAVVKTFNTMCETFPSVIIAGVFGFKAKPYFEVDEESERKNVKVSF